MKSKKGIFQTVAILLFGMIISGSAIAGDFPEYPIVMVVGFQAGGSIDIMSRILAEEISKDLGQSVVVQNKPGGGGNLATTFVKNEKADGYIISAIPSQLIVSNSKMAEAKYSSDDFFYLGGGAFMQEAFVSLPDKPYKNFKEMINWAKENKKKLVYGSMTPIDIAITKYISKQTGVEILPFSTKGGADIMSSVLGGHVDFGFSGGIHYSYVKAGRMQVLMGLGHRPLAAFPEASTIIDMGWDIPMDNFFVAFLNKDAPENIKEILSKAVAKAFKSDKFIEVVDKLSLVHEYLSPEQSKDQIQKTIKVIQNLDL